VSVYDLLVALMSQIYCQRYFQVEIGDRESGVLLSQLGVIQSILLLVSWVRWPATVRVRVRVSVRVHVSLREGYFVSVLGRRSRKRWLVVYYLIAVYSGICVTGQLILLFEMTVYDLFALYSK
jgi:hypothetical protein